MIGTILGTLSRVLEEAAVGFAELFALIVDALSDLAYSASMQLRSVSGELEEYAMLALVLAIVLVLTILSAAAV